MVAIIVYRRKVLLLNTLPIDFRRLGKSRGILLLTGNDSSNRNDHIKTIIANNGGVRNTTCQEEICKTTDPRNGASTGVKRKIVMRMLQPLIPIPRQPRRMLTVLNLPTLNGRKSQSILEMSQRDKNWKWFFILRIPDPSHWS